MKRLLYFSAPWCGPCRQLGPTMDQVARNYPVIKINVDEDSFQVQQFKIKNVPTVGAHPAQTYIDMYNQN